MKFKVRREFTVPSPLTWPSIKKSDGTGEFEMTGSMDGCSILPETKFVSLACLCMGTAWILSAGIPLP